MKNALLTAALVLAIGLMPSTPVEAQTTTAPAPTTCMDQGFTGTKVLLCAYICEWSYKFTPAQRNVFIRKWKSQFSELPHCLKS